MCIRNTHIVHFEFYFSVRYFSYIKQAVRAVYTAAVASYMLTYSCTCFIQSSCSQLHVIVQLYVLFTKQLFRATCYCAAAFCTFLLAIYFNIETTVMVTSLLLNIHHAVTALILNLGTVGSEVLTSRPGRFTLGKDQALIE